MSDLATRLVNLNQMPQDPIWLRLGFRSRHTEPGAKGHYGPIMTAMLAESWVRIFYIEQPVQSLPDRIRVGDYAIASRLVAERFGAAGAALVMGASVRPEDEARLRSLQAQGDMQSAVLMDAVLSEKADFALDFIEQEMSLEWRRSGRSGGRRISCGYGDFSLEHQQFFHRILQFENFGIRLSDRFILDPEKTVTALLPIYSGAKQP